MFEARLWDTIERLSSSYSGSELGGSLTNLSSTLCDYNEHRFLVLVLLWLLLRKGVETETSLRKLW